MSIGGYGPESEASLLELAKWLSSSSVELVVENDQSESAGTLASLVRFFEAADSHGLKLGMTFDMGNWHWTGECPLQAASVMTHRICYVHCKGVQRQPSRWVAVPLVESSAPWRAILRAQPKRQPWAIEYPLAGDDLLAVTRNAVEQLRQIASGLT
jgi:sugar phosphate isomerase/epimerase